LFTLRTCTGYIFLFSTASEVQEVSYLIGIVEEVSGIMRAGLKADQSYFLYRS